jgi:prevent-host-death family protein
MLTTVAAVSGLPLPIGAPMTITTLSSREFNQDTGRAKKAASDGPVFITDRGKPAHVLLSIEEYRRITAGHRKIADALAMPGIAGIEFDPPRASIGTRPADFRVTVDPSGANGLRMRSQIMADKPVTVRRERIGQTIGRLSADDVRRLNAALAFVMGLAD